jgi:hypothetical protein
MREACEHPRDQKRTTHETHWLTDTMAISSESELVVKPGLHIGCPSVYIYQLTISPISQLGIWLLSHDCRAWCGKILLSHA